MLRPALFSLATALTLALLAPAPRAQALQLGPDVSLLISGTVQPRLSYGYQDGDEPGERLGVGVRRARFQMRASYQDVGFEFDFDGSSGDVRSVDLYGFYNASETVQVRAGLLPPAQPRAYVPTSHSRIDAIERAAIAERWSQGTIGSSGRDVGIDVEVEAGRTSAVLSLHSGTGSLARGLGNFRESITAGDVTRGRGETGAAVSAMVAHEPAGLPGVEVGAFVSANPVGNEDTEFQDMTRGYTSGGAHVYWGARPGSQPVRLKLDALGVRYEEVDGFVQEAVGVSGLGAVRVLGHGEVFGRYEAFWPDLDGDAETFVTVGGSYSPSAAAGRAYRLVRFTLAYAYRDAIGEEDAHLAVLQGQFAF